MYQVGINNIKDIEMISNISNKIKDIVSNIDIEYFKRTLTAHYRTLNLIDSKGKWMTERLNKLSDKLIPQEISSDSLEIFVDEITMLCTRNNYFMSFLKECKNKKFEKLQTKFNSEGKEVIADVVIYAYMAETLSKECSNDYFILEELYHCFSVNRNKMKSFKNLPLVYKFKLLSVENSIRSYLKCHKKKILREDFGSIAVSKSILGFMCVSLIDGGIGNIKSGYILAKSRCGLKYIEKDTGAGPSVWSEDKKIIEHAFPLTEYWNNLHQVWNMCIFMNLKDFPYNIANLIIPQVSGYYNNPCRYLYNMNISLYIYLNFLSFNYRNKKVERESVIDWRDRELIKVFLSSNKKSAKIYNEKLKKVRG